MATLERDGPMRRAAGLLSAGLIGAAAFAGAASAAPQTYHYLITHSRYGRIGTYDRVVDETGAVTRAQSQMKISVKMLGVVVHREVADQAETWRDGRLASFRCVTTVNGKPVTVIGEARGGGFMVTSPSGTATAPADVVASDPMGFKHLGRAEVVSLKSGKLEPINVTGGETEQFTLQGAPEAVRHYRVNTASQPDKWEVWLDPQGVPVRFRSLEHGDTVDFTLTSPPKPVGAPGSLAMMRPGQGLDRQ